MYVLLAGSIKLSVWLHFQAFALAVGCALFSGPLPLPASLQLEVFTDLPSLFPAPIRDGRKTVSGLFQMYVCQRPPSIKDDE